MFFLPMNEEFILQVKMDHFPKILGWTYFWKQLVTIYIYVNIHICIYVYINMYICICICIYIQIHREGGRKIMIDYPKSKATKPSLPVPKVRMDSPCSVPRWPVTHEILVTGDRFPKKKWVIKRKGNRLPTIHFRMFVAVSFRVYTFKST